MSYDVFISHDARDRAVAEAACDALERAGHLCWIAPRDLAEGDEPGAAGFVGIAASKLFLLILSAAGAGSKQVRREAARARKAGLTLIPLRIEEIAPGEALHHEIAGHATLDALPPPASDHFDQLTALVGRLLEGKEGAPTRPLTLPPQPLPGAKRPTPAWLPIAIVALIGIVAIALVAGVVAVR